jgi:hypothetical protein
MASSQPRLTEEQLYFYEDRICGEADHIYRYCIALTLNQDAAQKLLISTFQVALKKIDELKTITDALELRSVLLSLALIESAAMKESPPGGSALFTFLKKLPADIRAVLISRDLAGLAVEQISKSNALSPELVYERLAVARKALHDHVSQANSQGKK